MNTSVSVDRVDFLEESADALKNGLDELKKAGDDLKRKIADNSDELGPFSEQIEEIYCTYMNVIHHMENRVIMLCKKLTDIVE